MRALKKQEGDKMAEYKGAAKEGARAMALMKKREKMKADIEAAKNKISEVRFWEAIFEIVSSTLTFTETFVTCSFQATIWCNFLTLCQFLLNNWMMFLILKVPLILVLVSQSTYKNNVFWNLISFRNTKLPTSATSFRRTMMLLNNSLNPALLVSLSSVNSCA